MNGHSGKILVRSLF